MTLSDDLASWMGWSERDPENLSRAWPLVEPHVDEVVDAFYRRVMSHDGTASVLEGPEQMERLRRSLAKWLENVFRGPHDAEYVQLRRRIGKRHVEVGLPEHFMFAAMYQVRFLVNHILAEADADYSLRDSAARILTFDLAMMTEAYHRKQSRDAVARSEHLAGIGQLAASIAHELRNPLAGISGAIQLVSRGLEEGHRHVRLLDAARAQVNRMAELVEDLLDFAKPRSPELVPVVLREEVERAIGLLVDGPTVFTAGDGSAYADRDELSRILRNLFENAGAAGADRVEVHLDDGRILVTDDGPGIPDHVARRIFEPFFTTRTQGTGLGLPIAARAAEAMNGSLSLEPGGNGATFLVDLPVENSL